MRQAIQVENAAREKERWCKVETACEEGGVSQNNIFLVPAQEEERGGIRRNQMQPWDSNLQIVIN